MVEKAICLIIALEANFNQHKGICLTLIVESQLQSTIWAITIEKIRTTLFQTSIILDGDTTPKLLMGQSVLEPKYYNTQLTNLNFSSTIKGK